MNIKTKRAKKITACEKRNVTQEVPLDKQILYAKRYDKCNNVAIKDSIDDGNKMIKINKS